jgi:hypothetical protein
MHTFNVSLFVVFSCIAKIGATPTESRAPDDNLSVYVPQQRLMEVLTRLKKFFSSPSPDSGCNIPNPGPSC